MCHYLTTERVTKDCSHISTCIHANVLCLGPIGLLSLTLMLPCTCQELNIRPIAYTIVAECGHATKAHNRDIIGYK